MNNDTIPFEDSIFINQEAKYILSLLNDETKSSSWLLTNGIHKIGIFVNGELTDESVLTSGSRIQIGKFNLIITKVDKK